MNLNTARKLNAALSISGITAIMALAPNVYAQTTSTTWTKCASENGTCSVSGTQQVRYGANGSFVTKTVTGSVQCTNAVFGDPIPGVVKECDVASTTSSTSTTTTAPTTTTTSGTDTTTWTGCASENGTCTIPGTRQVRYGANSSYVYKTLSTSTQCSNSVFGDPAPGVVKHCDYASSTVSTSTSPTTTTTTSPTTSTTTNTSTTNTSTTSGARDKYKQPFAVNSIWNMPIGSGAVYVPANISGNPAPGQWVRMPQMDEEHIIMKPTSPITTVNYSSAGWNSGANRCGATGGALKQVPMPSDYVVPNNIENSSAAFLMADGHTIAQMQPFARCSTGASATALVTFPDVDLFGDGRTGAHGGSGLSAIGGSLRIGELRPGSQGPNHALKVNVYAKQALYKCTTASACYRWPANNADGYAVGWYGAESNNGNAAVKMGALLALPASLNISSLGLETEPAKQLAWTLQNYGAYIVDDTYAPQFAINAENGPDGSFKTQFQADYGFAFEQLVSNASSSPWVRDIQRLVQALNVVDNNGPNSIGGGGTPRQPLAAPIQ
ncbi:hypothetical protein [Noviherbaspirillum pedocola]|uniref:Uncharacterized protein n=1 Tax=Noviherbaspirillum pedocola TaxID=2801341 RepID=A0A934T093_9BURK|nr:hypothetical protein [Noviherbaspirillum pedocola]MBK4739042.1 hypothetical protein [Noviherbaspirillum pedocola]